MRDGHIIRMLEERPVSRLSDDELLAIKAHAAECRDCLQAYRAAQVSQSLIKARASEAVDPSPFFKTRVMAAIREKHLSPELPAVVKWWRAARAMVSVMFATVAVLVGLTVFDLGAEEPAQPAELAASQNLYSAEFAILDDGGSDDDLIYDQVLGTVYDLEDGDGD